MTTDREELLELFESLCDGTITPAQHERLQQRLAAEAAARQLYFDYLDLRVQLRQWQRASCGEQASPSIDSPDAVPAAPTLIQTSPPLPVPFATVYPAGSFVFSYAAAVVIVGIGLLIGWTYHVSPSRPDYQQVALVAPQPAPPALRPEPEMIVVGRVTGMLDCQWADPKTGTVHDANVALGRTYVLAAGLMEITYDTGARVILQGPCTYEVESRTGGFLSLGRLTARVEKRGTQGDRRSLASSTVKKSNLQISKSPPLPLFSSPLFTVRTPTATVTDLGTEFGVEVDKSGASKALVYEGKVEMRAIDGGNATPISLGVNESARIDVATDRGIVMLRQAGEKSTFVREMPKSVPIVLFNTGARLKEGDADPHWQTISRSDDPQFEPRAALVRVAGGSALENDPASSQWLSLVADDSALPEEVTYVFRTTFDLSGMQPSTAVLRGKFIADDRVVAIRLNGRRLSVPLQHDGEPFIYWTKFVATAGFVKGINVLEVDVLNAGPFTSPSKRRTSMSRMSLRMELHGEALPDRGSGGGKVSGKASPTPTHENKKAANAKSQRGMCLDGLFPFLS